jgi:hypothetical protein
MTYNKNIKLPPINYNKITKTVLSDGTACYPTDYFHNHISKEDILHKYTNYNKIQSDRLLKYDRYNNVNYIRKGVFYVKNHKYTAFSNK